MGTRKYAEFHQTSLPTTVKRILFCSMCGLPLLSGIFLCPKEGITWWHKLLFKVVVPITLGNFYLFGCSKYVALKAGLINTTISDASSLLTCDTTNDFSPAPHTSRRKSA